MSDELKPCPFCGGMAEIVEIDEGENAGGSCVCCTTCLASSKVEFGFKENFISNWNRRVQTLAPDAVARLWHAARLGLDMARANDLTKTAETIMEAMNAVECPCNGSDEMCPCQNRRGSRAAQLTPDQYRREGFQAGIAAAAQVLLDACPNPIFDQLKPALMGEVTERVGYTDEDGNEVYYDRPVSWDAMKEIIRAALRALKGDDANG